MQMHPIFVFDELAEPVNPIDTTELLNVMRKASIEVERIGDVMAKDIAETVFGMRVPPMIAFVDSGQWPKLMPSTMLMQYLARLKRVGRC